MWMGWGVVWSGVWCEECDVGGWGGVWCGLVYGVGSVMWVDGMW